jgi:hypothetical protein
MTMTDWIFVGVAIIAGIVCIVWHLDIFIRAKNYYVDSFVSKHHE